MDLRFLVMCFIGFAGFFRIEELLGAQVKHTSFYESHMEIFLEESKCDQHRNGETVFIARLESKYCPVCLLEDFLKVCNIDRLKNLDAFLVPRLFKTKEGHRAAKNAGISYTTAREVFAEKITEFGLQK